MQLISALMTQLFGINSSLILAEEVELLGRVCATRLVVTYEKDEVCYEV